MPAWAAHPGRPEEGGLDVPPTRTRGPVAAQAMRTHYMRTAFQRTGDAQARRASAHHLHLLHRLRPRLLRG